MYVNDRGSRWSHLVARSPGAQMNRVAVLSTIAALLLVSPSSLGDQPSAPVDGGEAKVATWVRSPTEAGQQAEFLVVLAGQADLSGAASLATKAEKGRFVYDALRAVALREQRDLLDDLAAQGMEFRSFYIVNAVWVRGERQSVMDLAARPEVARIEGNPQVRAVDQAPVDPLPDQESQVADGAQVPAGIGANISYVRAPEVWSMGFTGQGIVIGGQDTGYDWDHPALQSQYRGWNGITATHDYSWHDAIHDGSPANACGVDLAAPCDDFGHGTHTMGTAVGSDGGANQIGMAPGAKWIGCRNMDAGVGTPARYLECFEFFLAPYPVGGSPAEGNPALAPDVTINSWSCPADEGCDWQTLQGAVDAQQAAGILTVAAAGNTASGAGCNSIYDPPGIYSTAYTVGALSTGTDALAAFSNRGAVSVDGSNRPKPDLTAPGTGIYSSIPGGGYSSAWSGTSMATPHVVGGVALLWSARPWLRDSITGTTGILEASAVAISSSACSSGGVPNNLYGYGRLDVKAAVDQAAPWKRYLPVIARIEPGR
jgi:serine protease AprX